VQGQGQLTRRSPALEALFGMLRDDGRHCVLDLGVADGRRLRLLGRFARRVRFAGLLPGLDDLDWEVALDALPASPRQPYDVVLAWDLLDRVPAAHHAAVVGRLAEITAGSARLYAVVDSTGGATTRPLSFTLAELDQVSEHPVGPPRPPANAPMLPAHVERSLRPFEVVRAFTLRSGQREYVALKSG